MSETNLRQKLSLDALLRRAEADDDQQRYALQTAGQEREPAQGRRVGPVEIVDDERERLALRDVRGEAVETVEDGERDIRRRGSRHLLVVEEPLGERSGAGQELLPLRRLDRGEIGLEQLAHDPVGELLLEVGAPRGKHFEAGCRSEPGAPPRRAASCRPQAAPRPRSSGRHPQRRSHDGLDSREPPPRARAGASCRPGPRGAAAALAPSSGRGSRAKEVTRQPVDVELVERLRPVEVAKRVGPRSRRRTSGGSSLQTRLAVVLDRRTWPRAPRRRCAPPGEPRARCSRRCPRLASPVCSAHARTRTFVPSGHSWDASARCPAATALTAAPALRKTTKKESPSSRPRSRPGRRRRCGGAGCAPPARPRTGRGRAPSAGASTPRCP